MTDPASPERFEYEQALGLIRILNEIRFKLLAFVPTIAGAAVGLLSRGSSHGQLLAVGLVGLVATAGLFVYELRNSQHYDTVVAHAQDLEARLGLTLLTHVARPPRLFGVELRQRRALGLVYGAAFGAWTYLVVWGFLGALGAGGAQTIGAVCGVAVALGIVWVEVRTVSDRAAPETTGP